MFSKLLAILVIAVTSLTVVASAETVKCSYYSTKFDGHRTSSGQRFDSEFSASVRNRTQDQNK
jgi:rare lipoprotein A (peptidoglycan hydrolase)